MEQGQKEIMERWKALAELFLNKNIKCFVKDIYNNWYFADILYVGEDSITLKCFSPEDRKGEKVVIHWLLIKSFEEYKEDRK